MIVKIHENFFTVFGFGLPSFILTNTKKYFFRTNLASIHGKSGQMVIVAMSTLKAVMRPKSIVLVGPCEIQTTIM